MYMHYRELLSNFCPLFVVVGFFCLFFCVFLFLRKNGPNLAKRRTFKKLMGHLDCTGMKNHIITDRLSP